MPVNSIVKKASYFVSCEMKQMQMRVFLVGCIASFILEFLACLFKSVFSVIASRIWMLSVILFVLFFVFVVVKQLYEDVRDKKFILPFIFFLVFCFFAFQIGNYGFSDLSYESTQEVAAGLNALKQPDWNYTAMGFTGYPTKQYIINAIPALFLGRCFFALNMGFAIPFLIGLTLLFIELRKLTSRLGIDEKFSIIPIFMIAFCPFISEFYYTFEQTITPVSYAIIVIALFLRMLRKRSLIAFSVLTISACMLPFLYTPALAFMGLFVVMMIYHAINVITGKSKFVNPGKKNPNYLISVFASAFTPALFFICTLVSKRNDRFLSAYGDSFAPEKQSEYMKSFLSFFVDSDSLFWGVFGAFVLIYLIAGLTFRLKFHDFLISLWCIATALFSFLLPGVSTVFNFYYPPLILAQRSMVMVPVIAVSLLVASAGFLRKHTIRLRNDCVAVLTAAFMLFGISSLFQVHKANEYHNYTQHMKYIMKYCGEVTEYHGNSNEDVIVIIVHTDNDLISHLWDFTQYYYPNAKIYVFPTEQFGGIDIYDVIYPRYVFSENPNTASYYNVEFNSRDFKNYRFNENTTIYFKYFEPDYTYVDMYDPAFIEEHNLQQYLTN